MRDLNHDFKLLCQRNRDGSMATQHDREVILSLVADQLQEGGFHHLRAPGVRSKHIDHLVKRWHEDGIASSTVKNRMSATRWLLRELAQIAARTRCSFKAKFEALTVRRDHKKSVVALTREMLRNLHRHARRRLSAPASLRSGCSASIGWCLTHLNESHEIPEAATQSSA